MSIQNYCELIYFHRYSDFCFEIGDDFTVRVSENRNGQTEVFVEHCGVHFKAVTFEQCALSVFREESPTDWICKSSGDLKRLYRQRKRVTCRNMSEFFKKVLKKY